MGVTSKAQHEITVNADQAEQAYKKLSAAEKKAFMETKRHSKALKEQKGGFDQSALAAGRYVATAVGIGSVTAALAKGVSLVKEYREHLNAVANKQNTMAREMVNLALMQGPGEEAAALREAAVMGARHGVAPGQAADTVTELQSVYGGDFSLGMVAARESFKLQQLGVSQEDAKTIVGLGKEIGMGPQESSSLVYRGAKYSRFGPSEFAQAMPAMSEYAADPEFGIASMAAISKMKEASKLEVFTRAGSEAIMKENELSKKLKLHEIPDYMDRLHAIRDEVAPDPTSGLYTAAIMARAGVPEKRQGSALAIMLNNMDEIERNRASLRQRDTGVVQSEVERTGAIPMIAAARAEDHAVATMEATQLYGPGADAARAEKASRLAVGAEAGFGWGVNQETGEAKWLRRIPGALADLNRRGGESYGPAAAYVAPPPRDTNLTAPAVEQLNVNLERLIGTLETTNSVTQDNTAATSAASASAPSSPSRNGGIE